MDAIDECCRTPLYIAVKHGDIELATLLLDEGGANPDLLSLSKVRVFCLASVSFTPFCWYQNMAFVSTYCILRILTNNTLNKNFCFDIIKIA